MFFLNVTNTDRSADPALQTCYSFSTAQILDTQVSSKHIHNKVIFSLLSPQGRAVQS